MRLIATITTCLAITGSTHAIWGASCGPVGPTQTHYTGQVVRNGWYKHEPTGSHAHYTAGSQDAWASTDWSTYRTYDAKAGTFGPEQQPPWCTCCKDCPCQNCHCTTTKPCTASCTCNLPPHSPLITDKACQQLLQTGIDRSKMPAQEDYRINGLPTDQHTAHKILTTGGKLTDDTSKLRLTLVAPKEDQQRLTTDINSHQALAPWRDKLLLQTYDPGHWAAAGVGLPPGLTIQAPPDKDGKGPVLHREQTYTSAEQLADALRKADPSYKPANDPNLTKPPTPPVDPAQVPLWAWAIAGVALLYLRRKE